MLVMIRLSARPAESAACRTLIIRHGEFTAHISWIARAMTISQSRWPSHASPSCAMICPCCRTPATTRLKYRLAWPLARSSRVFETLRAGRRRGRTRWRRMRVIRVGCDRDRVRARARDLPVAFSRATSRGSARGKADGAS